MRTLLLSLLAAVSLTATSLVNAEETPPPAVPSPVDLVALKAEVDRLKGLVPDQAHVMADVGYHFSNLWFAGENENWALAEFYVGEVRNHLRWAVKTKPIRKDSKGAEIKLDELLKPIDTGPLETLKKSIVAKEKTTFENSYRGMLVSCYACHAACEKPYLKLQIPERPEAPIINMSGKD